MTTDESIDARAREIIAEALAPPSRERVEASVRVIATAMRATRGEQCRADGTCRLVVMFSDALDEIEILRARLELAQKRTKGRKT